MDEQQIHDIDARPKDEAIPLIQGDNDHGDGLVEAAPITEAVTKWRVADALLTLRQQINDAFPRRNKASDGTIGDIAHQGRGSDHNPWVVDRGIGVVTAMDVTHDPASGCDADRLAEALRGSRDPRIKYIIWNRRIANSAPIGGAPAWAWRTYTGKNPHNHHCHLSVKPDKALYDAKTPWKPQGAAEAVAAEQPEREIRFALSALGANAEAPALRDALVEARDAADRLLARYDELAGGAD